MTHLRNFTVAVAILLTGLSAALAQQKQIDLQTVLFGIEYTFQDQEMVNEPGRDTMSTPHKEGKAQACAVSLAKKIGLTERAVVSKTTWKPGHYIKVPNDGRWVVNSEPVTIEINTTPRYFNDIEATAQPIFEATAENNLVPYVNPAAERSGMGHIHIGAARMGDNPFFKNPLLLRNVMVYLHKHPALLYGFSEAYDNGIGSNIESYHIQERQLELKKAVELFDAWYATASPEQKRDEGFNSFIKSLKAADHKSDFFEHYRYMNLEHVARGHFQANDKGKLTIEFRNFRPPNSAAMAKSFAALLVAVMEKQSQADHIEHFEWISESQYERFNTGSKVTDDWRQVRAELQINDSNLNQALEEYVSVIHRQKTALKSLPDSELFSAYSQKERKGTFFELRLPATKYPIMPNVTANGKAVEFESVHINQQQYWIASIDTKSLGILPVELLNGRPILQLSSGPGKCNLIFSKPARAL